MNRRTLFTIIAALVILIGAPVAWYLVSPLFIDQTVDEAFPFDSPTVDELAETGTGDTSAGDTGTVAAEMPETVNEEEAVSDESVSEKAVSDEAVSNEETVDTLLEDEPEASNTQVEVEEVAVEMPDTQMEEEMPETAANEWVVAAQGDFVDADDFHQGSGTATIFQQGEQQILRFENFESTNGPDLQVLLVENVNGTNSEELGEYVNLGSLKGNIGNQNYEIPAGVDLSKYNGVVIYCMPFHVVFSTAAF